VTTRIPEPLADALAGALGSPVVAARRPSCGLSAAERWVVRLGDGRSVFVKAATDDATEAWLRTETAVVGTLDAPWHPRVVAELEVAGRPALVSEDLSGLHWPADFGPGVVVWRPGDVERVLATLAEVGATPAPASLPGDDVPACWARVLSRPDDLAALGVCSRAWATRSGPALIEADEAADLSGALLVHGDVRSDNLALGDDRVVLVDWSDARRGNPRHDVAELLPLLHLEGAPPPWTLAPAPDLAPLVARASGRTALRTMDDDVPVAWLHRILRRILAIELDWIAAVLGLPRRDGPPWQQIQS